MLPLRRTDERDSLLLTILPASVISHLPPPPIYASCHCQNNIAPVDGDEELSTFHDMVNSNNNMCLQWYITRVRVRSW